MTSAKFQWRTCECLSNSALTGDGNPELASARKLVNLRDRELQEASHVPGAAQLRCPGRGQRSDLGALPPRPLQVGGVEERHRSGGGEDPRIGLAVAGHAGHAEVLGPQHPPAGVTSPLLIQQHSPPSHLGDFGINHSHSSPQSFGDANVRASIERPRNSAHSSPYSQRYSSQTAIIDDGAPYVSRLPDQRCLSPLRALASTQVNVGTPCAEWSRGIDGVDLEPVAQVTKRFQARRIA